MRSKDYVSSTDIGNGGFDVCFGGVSRSSGSCGLFYCGYVSGSGGRIVRLVITKA